jgi:hypothetical protein
MGVTVHYRGRIESPKLQAFEDFVVEWVREHGGAPRVWRSRSDEDPGRVVRGVLVELASGLEGVSFLVSPEAWLLPVTEIEQAERAPLPEPPWVFVKTQFAAIEAHVALVELLSAIKERFVPSLEVNDEGEYWERRDLNTLKARRALIDEASPWRRRPATQWARASCRKTRSWRPRRALQAVLPARMQLGARIAAQPSVGRRARALRMPRRRASMRGDPTRVSAAG